MFREINKLELSERKYSSHNFAVNKGTFDNSIHHRGDRYDFFVCFIIIECSSKYFHYYSVIFSLLKHGMLSF